MQSVAPGTSLPELRRSITQELVNLYAEASDDWNPLHTDTEFAATTRFGRTIAHGQLTLSIVSQCLTRWAWPAYAHGGELAVAFIGPVLPGDEVVVRAEVTEIDEGADPSVAVCDVGAFVEDRKVLAATARIPLNQEEQS